MWVTGGRGGKALTSKGYERGDWAALPEIPGLAWLPQSPRLAGNLPFLSCAATRQAPCEQRALSRPSHRTEPSWVEFPANKVLPLGAHSLFSSARRNGKW